MRQNCSIHRAEEISVRNANLAVLLVDSWTLWLETQEVLAFNVFQNTLNPHPPGLEPKENQQFLKWAEHNQFLVPMCSNKKTGVVLYQATVGDNVTDLLAADVVYYCHHVPGYVESLQWLVSIGDTQEVSASHCPLQWHQPWPGMTPWQGERAARAFVQELSELGLLARLTAQRVGNKIKVRFRVNREACELAVATVACDVRKIEELIFLLFALNHGAVPLHPGGVVTLEAEVPQTKQRPRGRPRKNRL